MADHEVHIEPGWRPGAIGRITEMHAGYYSREHGFGPVFEAKVAEGLAGHLYEGEGFRLIRSWRGDQWGSAVVEQMFERKAGR